MKCFYQSAFKFWLRLIWHYYFVLIRSILLWNKCAGLLVTHLKSTLLYFIEISTILTENFFSRIFGWKYHRVRIYLVRRHPQLPGEHSGGSPWQAGLRQDQWSACRGHAGTVPLLRGIPTMEGTYILYFVWNQRVAIYSFRFTYVNLIVFGVWGYIFSWWFHLSSS